MANRIPKPSHLPQTQTKGHFVLTSDELYPLLPLLFKPFGGKVIQCEQECLIPHYLGLEN
ncbi:unnamed protein product, partial [Callosobruchus maculatus]